MDIKTSSTYIIYYIFIIYQIWRHSTQNCNLFDVYIYVTFFFVHFYNSKQFSLFKILFQNILPFIYIYLYIGIYYITFIL